MLQPPRVYKHYDRSPLDCVYKALRNKDLADCVVQAIGVLKQTNNFLKFERIEKSDTEALNYGGAGKEAFCNGDYQSALMNYNMALMQAPVNSKSMMLSYYSRAELLLKAGQFRACLKDVETCLALDCPDNMILKLQEMKDVACNFTWVEQLERQQSFNPFAEEFFTLQGARNPDIPCATSDVEVNKESGQPKVVAARDIPVGTVVAVETAFVGATHTMNHVTSCHYCHKMDFNMTPCEGCCAAMFCDRRCKEKAVQDGHNFECKIIDMLTEDVKLPLRATLKIRQLCSSWDEFITASNELGVERMKNSSFAEIFGPQKFSLLNSHHDTHFIYGTMFNICMRLANIIHFLEIHTSFLPDSPEEKSAAIHAVSRVMMHLALYCPPVKLQLYITLCTEGLLKMHFYHNKGYFPFISNLPNSCLPNSFVLGLRNSAALITTAPVKKGDELTFSYIGHWCEDPEDILMRAKKMFVSFRTVCKDCVICRGRTDNNMPNTHLSDTQIKAYKKFRRCSISKGNFTKIIKSDYKDTCNILLALSDAPYSKEYLSSMTAFVKCLMYCVRYKFPNVVLSKSRTN